jgi:signal transduction histidine kinase
MTGPGKVRAEEIAATVRKAEQFNAEQRMAELEKFAATGKLVATMAHEINNPLDAIKNALHLLAPSVPEEAMPLYNILKTETDRAARLVRQMLGSDITEQFKPANVNNVIQDALAPLDWQLQRANIEVTTEMGELPSAVVAVDQIGQALTNLMINAKDAMPQGGKLRIRTRHLPHRGGPQGLVRILIADTGTGISPDMKDSIFDPFVTTKGENGTGLGLWIVKGTIESHSGKLSVRSALGKGTVFKIDLPVVQP